MTIMSRQEAIKYILENKKIMVLSIYVPSETMPAMAKAFVPIDFDTMTMPDTAYLYRADFTSNEFCEDWFDTYIESICQLDDDYVYYIDEEYKLICERLSEYKMDTTVKHSARKIGAPYMNPDFHKYNAKPGILPVREWLRKPDTYTAAHLCISYKRNVFFLSEMENNWLPPDFHFIQIPHRDLTGLDIIECSEVRSEWLNAVTFDCKPANSFLELFGVLGIELEPLKPEDLMPEFYVKVKRNMGILTTQEAIEFYNGRKLLNVVRELNPMNYLECIGFFFVGSPLYGLDVLPANFRNTTISSMTLDVMCKNHKHHDLSMVENYITQYGENVPQYTSTEGLFHHLAAGYPKFFNQ